MDKRMHHVNSSYGYRSRAVWIWQNPVFAGSQDLYDRRAGSMIRLIKKFGILFVIFAAVLIVYMGMNRERLLQGDVVYTVIGEQKLPVVYVEMYGWRMNPMHGYRQDMGNTAARDSLTVLPQDRALALYAGECQETVTGIRYEIRSLDLERLVENTTVEEWQQDDGLAVVLPIQNLLARKEQYVLRLELDLAESGTIYYYTRILWPEEETDIAQSMIDLAAGFTEKTFQYDQARDLVMYLETNDAEDNSSFGRTTIRSNFAHLTWGRLRMRPASELQIRLKELDGIMSCVAVDYLAARETEDGRTEYYEVEENFTMKWNSIRTYLMDYERTVDQIFEGAREDYSGRRIMLGITNDESISVVKSPNRKVIGYRAGRDLWCFDQARRESVQVFSFREREDGMKPDFMDHGIRILRVEDDGSVDFLVYGYQNRGTHEGESGIAGYHYEGEGNILQERFFVPSALALGQLEQDLEQLSYLASSNMLYIYLDHAIYGIDMTSNEHMVVADALQEGSLAVSTDRGRIAWLEGGEPYTSTLLHLLDLETGDKLDIRGDTGECVRTLGFVGRDLVYGIASENDLWVVNGRIVDLPMKAVEIMNDQMQVETRYEKEGYYVAGVSVEDSRIHLERVTRTGEQSFVEAQEDTIVCNVEMGPGRLDGIGWYASQDKGKVYFVQLDNDAGGGRGIRTTAPGRISREQAGVLDLSANTRLTGLQFYAYGGGKLMGITGSFGQAVSLAYDKMGIVTDQNHRILWSRVNRPAAVNIRDVTTAFSQLSRHLDEFEKSRAYGDGAVLLDARGCSMQQTLYFVGQGVPVLAYTGEGSYLVLCGFDQYNVTVYDPSTGHSEKVGLNDSTEFFRQRGNDFVCAVAGE